MEGLALAHHLDRRLDAAAHVGVAHRRDRDLEAPAPAGCRRRAASTSERQNSDSAKRWSTGPRSGSRSLQRSSASRPAAVAPPASAATSTPPTSAPSSSGQLRAGEAGDRQRDAGDQRQLGVQLVEEAHELGHDVDRHDDDHGDRQADQHRRVDQRRDHPLARVEHQLHVADEAADDLLELAAALAGLERRGVEAAGTASPCAAKASERSSPLLTRSRMSVSTALKCWFAHPLEHQVERLEQRQAGLEQRRELLVEDQEVLRPGCVRRRRPQAADAASLRGTPRRRTSKMWKPRLSSRCAARARRWPSKTSSSDAAVRAFRLGRRTASLLSCARLGPPRRVVLAQRQHHHQRLRARLALGAAPGSIGLVEPEVQVGVEQRLGARRCRLRREIAEVGEPDAAGRPAPCRAGSSPR